MEHSPLTITNVIKGKIGTLLNGKLLHEPSINPLSAYKLIRDITPIYSSTKERVGIYENKKGTRVIIKKSSYVMEDLNSIYLKNEAFILKKLTQIHGIHKIFPSFIQLKQDKNQVVLITEFVEGKPVDTLNKNLRCEVIMKTFVRLQELSVTLKENNFCNLPIRRPFNYFLSFPINLLRLIVKDPTHIGDYLNMGLLFYLHYGIGFLYGVSLGLTHRDLYPSNMLYDATTGHITVLDWESTVISDSLYDLAQIAMIYTEEFGTSSMLDFLKEHLDNNAQRRRFIGLAIFNSIQILAQNKREDDVFKETQEFLHTFLEEIAPALLYKKSPFEMINAMTLSLIWLFYKVTGMHMASPQKKIVLCYHSIGNDGWRFSTRVSTFKSHIQFLKAQYKLIPLYDLLHQEGGGVSISFDDGYHNVITNALPLLEKEKIMTTMFVIGNASHVRRDELHNNLPLMSEQEISMLHTKGWEIGYHTNTHPNLEELSDAEMQKELIDSKKRLEKKLGITLRYFAYPRGIYNPKIVNYVRQAGFDAAFTVNGTAMSVTPSDPLLLDRVPMEGELSTAQLEALISPLGLWVSQLFMKILILKERYTTVRHREPAA